MPLINITTSAKVFDKNSLLKKSSKLISSLTKKSENFVMVRLEDCSKMFFAGSTEDCCYIELKSIGSIDPPKMSEEITKFFSLEIGVPTERIYINFINIEASMWSWNKSTFG